MIGPRGRAALALFLLAGALLTYRLGAKDFWEASEARPPESAREMRIQGDYLVQYTNGQVDLTKPPVYCWATGLAFRLLGGESEWAARVPSVLASLLILLLTFRLGARIAGERAGLFAALLLLTQARFLWQARLAELETFLALGVLTSYVGIDDAVRAPDGKGFRGLLLFHLGLGFAFAVKGPVALLLVLPGTVAYLLWQRRARILGSVAFLGTSPVFLAVGLSWYLAVVLRDPSTLATFLSYGRGDNVGHLRDPFYYLWNYPPNAYPWIVLVVLGLRLPWSSLLDPAMRERARLPFSAFVVTFLALSALHAKQTHYLIPIFPMGAVLGGVWIERALATGSLEGRAAWVLCSILVLLGGVALAISPHFLAGLPGFAWTIPLGAVVVLLAFAGIRGGRLRIAAPILAVALLEGFAVGHAAPSMNGQNSPRAFMRAARERVPPGAPLASTIFRSHSDHLWYLGRNVIETDVPGAAKLLAGGEVAFCLVNADEVAHLGAGVTVLVHDPSFQKKARDVALVTNRAGPQ